MATKGSNPFISNNQNVVGSCPTIPVTLYNTHTYIFMIEIEYEFFVHLLNCLANQKHIENLTVTDLQLKGQTGAEQSVKLYQAKTEIQASIDKAWLKGMDIANKHYLNSIKKKKKQEEESFSICLICNEKHSLEDLHKHIHWIQHD